MTLEESVKVEVRQGRLEAYLVIASECDAAVLELESCKAIVQGEGVLVTTTVLEEIESAIKAYCENPGHSVNQLIARGSAPVKGRDGGLDWEPGFDPTDDTPDEVEDDENVDHYTTNVYRMATEGDFIATLNEPESGRDGVAIDGGSIPAQPGLTFRLHTDQSVEILDDGKVIAKRSGLITLANDRLKILDLLDIPDYVDFRTGHIKFDGSVVIQKGVRDCFQVECSGELTIHGLVEAAELCTGQNAILNRGMAGKEKGTILVGNNLLARYLEAVRGRIERDMEIEKEIVNCDLIVGRDIRIAKGAIIGGLTRVGNSIELDVVGSPSGVPTTISLGDVPELTDALSKLDLFIPVCEQHNTAAQDEMEMITNASGANTGATNRERLTEIQFTMIEWGNRLDLLNTKRDEINIALSESTQPSLTVRKMLFADSVIIAKGFALKTLMDIKGPIEVFVSEKGLLQIKDLNSDDIKPLIELSEDIDASAAMERARMAPVEDSNETTSRAA